MPPLGHRWRSSNAWSYPHVVKESSASLTNPFESSFAQPTPELPKSKPRGVRWRLAPTILLGALGGIGLLLGIGFGCMSAYNLALILGNHELRDYVLTEKLSFLFTLVFGPIVCVCWGCSWIYSSSCFWNRRWRLATFLLIFGAVALAGMMNLLVPQ